jgi:hypothetical protein
MKVFCHMFGCFVMSINGKVFSKKCVLLKHPAPKKAYFFFSLRPIYSCMRVALKMNHSTIRLSLHLIRWYGSSCILLLVYRLLEGVSEEMENSKKKKRGCNRRKKKQ